MRWTFAPEHESVTKSLPTAIVRSFSRNLEYIKFHLDQCANQLYGAHVQTDARIGLKNTVAAASLAFL